MQDKQEEIVTTTPVTRSFKWANVGIAFSTIGTLILFGAFGLSYFNLIQTNQSMTQMLSQLQTEQSKTGQTVNALEQTAQKSEALSAQQEKIMNDWKAAQNNSLEKWYVAEAQYLVRLANDHLQYTYNTTMAVTLLKRADDILQTINDPNLLPIRKSLGADVVNVSAASDVDETKLYSRLVALSNLVDQLPLPTSIGKTLETQPVAVPNNATWWESFKTKSWESLSKIVIVRNDAANVLPLIIPEEKVFLFQNLHAQLDAAMWAVLHHNNEVYQANLTRASSWIQVYFVQDAEATKNMLQNLEELRKINIQPANANLAATLQLFDTYFTDVKGA